MRRSLNDTPYRPVVLALAGITAAYAIYLIRQRYLTSHDASEHHVPLRRRNAIRRHDGTTHRRTRSLAREVDSVELSEQAIAALRSREEHGQAYGFLDIHSVEQEVGQNTGRRRETQWPLLPAMLPTTLQFQAQEEGLTVDDAQGLRQHAELMFMDAFLVNQYPPSHTIGPQEASYLDEQLSRMGIGSSIIQQCIERFNTDPNFGAEMRQTSLSDGQIPPHVDGVTELQQIGNLLHALDGGESTADEHSNFDWRGGQDNGSGDREGQNTLNLLYNIAADQARKDGYVHRGVKCDGCGTMPIQDIRYRCANCVDFDLCESCEAQELHIKTHVFYKIRVPAPSLGALGNSRQCLPLWYPGKPSAMPRSLPRELASRLLHESGSDNAELDALWDQFRCLAGSEWNKDPNQLGMAIDRKTFDKCFVPPLSIRPPPPNLIYDRMFAFYDTNNDGLIGFEEFLKGLASLNDKSREGKLRRIFQGYDIDNDGFVDRKDFLRMFRAFYTLNQELNREKLAGMEEDLIEGAARDIVHGSQPISSAFPGSIPLGHASQSGVGKTMDAYGDLTIVDDRGVLDEESHDVGDRNQVIADVAIRYHSRSHERRRFRQVPETDESGLLEREWFNVNPANYDSLFLESSAVPDEGGLVFYQPGGSALTDVQTEDIVNALGGEVSPSEIMDPVERSRVLFAHSVRIDAEYQADIERRRKDALQERWRRRRFYTDVEEGYTAPSGYTEGDSSDDEADADEHALDSVTSASVSRPLSPRSRSSSKVRFEDSVTDTDYETRSNTSSRSIPVGERWGGYDISELEKDTGKEILYQAVQQGFNELLDQLFKAKEDLAMEAHRSRKRRRQCAEQIQTFAESLKAEPETIDHDLGQKIEKTVTIGLGDHRSPQIEDTELDALVEEAGYTFDTSRRQEEEEQEETEIPPPPPNRPPPLPPDHPLNTGHATIFHMSDILPRHPSRPPSLPTPPPPASPTDDPTLPQFRPHEPGTHPNATAPSKPMLNPNPSPHPDLQSRERELHPPYTPAQHELLTTYLRHEAVDREARVRGGFGRLEYAEFVVGMVGEDGGGGVGEVGGVGRAGADGMGRLGFVGSWIEMASF